MVETAVRSYSEVLLLSDFIRPHTKQKVMCIDILRLSDFIITHANGRMCCAFIFWGSVIVWFYYTPRQW